MLTLEKIMTRKTFGYNNTFAITLKIKALCPRLANNLKESNKENIYNMYLLYQRLSR